MYRDDSGIIKINHRELGNFYLFAEGKCEALFCDNDTNTGKLYDYHQPGAFKDGINDYIVNQSDSLHKIPKGTKAALNYDLKIAAGNQNQFACGLLQNLTTMLFRILINCSKPD
jgi:hypothetical protein